MSKEKSKYHISKKIHLNVKKDEFTKKFSETFELTRLNPDEKMQECSRFGFIKGNNFTYNAYCYGGERVVSIKGKISEQADKTVIEYSYKKRKARKLPAFIIYNIFFLGVIYYFNIYYIGLSLLILFNAFLFLMLKKDSMKKIKQFRKKILAFSK